MATIIGTDSNEKKIGSLSADSINGFAGNDTLIGKNGNDTLLGGAGADSLDGGGDNDRLLGDSGNDILLGGAGNDWLDGGADNDKLDGGAGADTLDGGTGADSMNGGDGNDLYLVDNIGDRVTEGAKATSGIDSVKSSISYTLPLNVEHLELTGSGDIQATGNTQNNKLTGNDSDNKLDGGSGADTLIGGKGDDTLMGGVGIDQLTGGDGSDTYVINSKEDRITETANDGDQDVVESSITYDLRAFVEVLTLTGTATIDGVGNELDNTLEGNDASNELKGEEGNDSLAGNAGDDTLTGGAGDDTLDGGDGQDQAIYPGNQGDYNIIPGDEPETWIVEDSAGNEGTDRLTGIETLVFADSTLDLSEYGSAPPELSFDDLSLTEGNSGSKLASFQFSLSKAATDTVSVDFSTMDVTATANSDYTPKTGTLIFAPGETRKSLSISILGDSVMESNEMFRLQLKNPNGLELSSIMATATITNDDKSKVSITSLSTPEGNSGVSQIQATVSLSAAATETVTVQYASLDGTARAGTDYNPIQGTLTFNPGEKSKPLNLGIKGDTIQEGDEFFQVLLSKPTGVALDDAAALATITLTDDDGIPPEQAQVLPTLSITGVTVMEGQSGTSLANLTVSLSSPSSQPVSVNYATQDGTATTGSDYVGSSDTLSFAPNQTTATIQTPVLGDTQVEKDETFKVNLSNPANAILGSNSSAVVTVNNDDAAAFTGGSSVPPYTLGQSIIDLGNEGKLIKPIQVDGGKWYYHWDISGDGTAVNDRVTHTFLADKFTLAHDFSTKNTVENTDSIYRYANINGVNLALPTVGGNDVNGVPATIGWQPGTSIGNDNAWLGDNAVNVTYDDLLAIWDAYNGTGTSASGKGTDSVDSAGRVNGWPPGWDNGYYWSAVPSVSGGNGRAEFLFSGGWVGSDMPIQNFSVALQVLPWTGTVTALPTLSISGVTVKEGDSGSSTANATVTLSAASSETVTVNYATQDGTALALSDYIATSGTLSFRPGETSQTIPVSILGDTTVETNETAQINLSAASNATLNSTASSAFITLNNDDDLIPVGSYTPGQAVIDLGKDYGKLIKPVQVDGGHWFYYWDRSGDGTNAGTQGAGYANDRDWVDHNWLDTLFQQDVNGRVEGENGAPVVGTDGDTDNTYRYATLNGVKLALPTVGDGSTRIDSYSYRPGTAVSGTANNPTYDDSLAIWDAYNGTGTGMRMDGTPPGWDDVSSYWSATPGASDHAGINLVTGFVDLASDFSGFHVAVEVL